MTRSGSIYDGGLGERLAAARQALARERYQATANERALEERVAAASDVNAAGRAFAQRARELGIPLDEYEVRRERRRRITRTVEYSVRIPVYDVGGRWRVYVDPDGVVYLMAPLDQNRCKPESVNGAVANDILDDMAAYLVRGERSR